MKKDDLKLIVVVCALAAISSFIICKMFITSPKNRQEKVEKTQTITTEFTKPSDKFFNAQSIDPTQQITIGGSNTKPF